ncbi:MAG: class I SAM-dependent methyltransferase [Clostridiales bacterium]|nr:class I SAM-dependent methyltransferase [Clostridiales bacterium]
MASYESFARVYDLFMSDTPYDEWCEYLHGLLLGCGVADGLVLELGCGTGQMTGRLSRLGYDMIGVDNSVDMLEIAREKQLEERNKSVSKYNPGNVVMSDEEDHSEVDCLETDRLEADQIEAELSEMEPKILYLLQDMREFELYGTVRAVVSVCDSMNYITEEEDLLQVFRLVNNYLDPGGVFIFDLNTVYKYEEILSENVFAENREEGSFIWENWYDSETRINEYDLTLYIRKNGIEAASRPDEGSNANGLFSLGKGESSSQRTAMSRNLYERYEETHYQKAWDIGRVCELLEKAGLKLEAVYDAFTTDAPHPESERIYIIAREQEKGR